jgi:hypothetical protein
MVGDDMRYAVIENGKVVNIAAATPEFSASQGWVECPDIVNIGWSYDGRNLIPPPRDIENEWNQIRTRRNALLVQSDAAVLPDRWATMTPENQQTWSTYRQALRDIPQSFSDPKDVVWPTKPE